MHARVLAGTAGVDQLVIADDVAERSAAVATDVGARAARGPEEALDAADAVVIAAGTDAHMPLVRESLRRGLPTFCEKPLAPDLEGTMTMAAEIDASNVPFQLGFQHRFDPAVPRGQPAHRQRRARNHLRDQDGWP